MARGGEERVHPLVWIALVALISLATAALVIASLFDLIPGVF